MRRNRVRRIRRREFAIAAVLAGTCLGLAGSATPAAAQLSCGATIGPNQTVTLQGDLTCPGGVSSLTVVGPATLDLGHHAVVCSNGSDSFPGILVLGDHAQVRNGIIAGCFVGVLLAGEGGHRIEDVTVADTCDSGFFVSVGADGNQLIGNASFRAGRSTPTACGVAPAFGPDGFTVRSDRNRLEENFVENPRGRGFSIGGSRNKLDQNQVQETGGILSGDGFGIEGGRNRLEGNGAIGMDGDGFDVGGSQNQLLRNGAGGNDDRAFRVAGSGNLLRENFADECEDGFLVLGDENRLIQNEVTDNRENGYRIDGSRNRLTRNRADGNWEDGFEVNGGGNRLTGNTAELNAGLGFDVEGDENQLKRNTVRQNFGTGIGVAGTSNRITRNTATANDEFDLQDIHADCDDNQWQGNEFGSSAAGDPPLSSPACIQ